MNALDIRNIMLYHGEPQKSFLCKIKRLAQQLIGEQYEAMYDFFCDVLEHEATYKIISARRCQVLFELFCPMILLDDDEAMVKGTFFSSNAIERYRNELRCRDASVLVVDDVLIHGRGIKELYEFLDPDYSRDNIEIAVFCRAVSATYVSEPLESRILKGYPTAFDYEWLEISSRLVKFIESSAIPYESFAGGLLSFSNPELFLDNTDFTSIVNSNRSQVFFEKREPPPFLKKISYDMCIRTYSNGQSGAFFSVPYVFLKNIKISKCNDFFAFVARQLNQEHCTHIIDELLTCNMKRTAYRMLLFSSLANRIYGLYLIHTYGIMKDGCPTRIDMELCFDHEVARELAELSWQDISNLLELIPPYEESSAREDEELSSYLLMPDSCEDDAMYRFLSMYYYVNGRLDEQAAEKMELRKIGLTMGRFYNAVNFRFYHDLTAAQIRCWDLGQASGIMRLRESDDCIAMYGVAGEQNFRFILQENRDYFRKRSKCYSLSFSGIKDNSDGILLPTDNSDGGSSIGTDASSCFATQNRKLLSQFLCDNGDRLEEWYIPQFFS